MMARIEAEEEYVRRLQRLSKFSFPQMESFFGDRPDLKGSAAELLSKPADILGALMALPEQLAESAARRLTLIEALRRRLLCPLEQSLSEQNYMKRKHKPVMIRLIRTRTVLADQVDRLRKRRRLRQQEHVALQQVSTAAMARRAREKVEYRDPTPIA